VLGGIDPLLIANRGEIAVRIAGTAHRLGLRTIGIFTVADADALHVDVVDRAIRIDSYLSVEDIVAAAKRSGARAIHPGYGFLSENAAFARAVIDAGLIWVGPPPDAVELMGDKAKAKRAAAAVGVPIVPEGDVHGFPVVVKAVAGGGGKGMRVVRTPEELEDATAAAKREAAAAFGDDRVMIERWIERPRHIEIQVLADRHGHIVHLGERECSLQRRHQKVIEECPSPVVSPELRERMGAAAKALAEACGYENAGTVEFVTTSDASEFFFLEMNTRLQVEHPVTELVYGIDLVEQQLRVAAGQRLTLEQDELTPVGHAVEARLYAEDPASGFLPATGTVRHYREPEGARVDSGIREGSTVGTAFDPMLAKVIAHEPDRDQALRRLDRALAQFELLGVQTNAAFARSLLKRADVRRGEQDTQLLERALSELELEPPEDLLLGAALAVAGTADPPGPWRRTFEQGDVRIRRGQIEHNGLTMQASVRDLREHRFAVELNGSVRRYAVVQEGGSIFVWRAGHQLEVRSRRPDQAGIAVAGGSLEAPMPATVLMVRVGNGDKVREGDVLLVLESMKMELQITAPHAGEVSELKLKAGDKVERHQALLTVAANGAGNE
jgi:acetyl-CoA/propionyl-CoA carboxylase biotin carboxyl carrier protein